ncbi:MAG: class I adenylate cyclase [Proteobacteria bacterium]|nr:class I adenylate cyclase [Pseudomonadota bacterium]MBU1715856.1 class I adenylate cyclase [Pseudomonadota bacterium]
MKALIEKVKKYQAYNRNRKIKAINFNEAKATIFFKVIPYLLHCNYPDLPGYVEDENCPFGIHLFTPEKMVDAEQFRKFFPTSTAMDQRTPSPFPVKPCIHSLKTIGSVGTIAQTEKSDCDYWLSIRRNELGPGGLILLEQKCHAIEQWALIKEVEVHFFLMDIEQTRDNSFKSDTDQESAGSALKILLKDELFRTHILVAGKMLLWWIIPPGLSETGYRKYVNDLAKSGEINQNNFIDLGYLTNIPKAEIFGACLWQMNKALDSPFKSVIKFAYLELLLQDDKQSLPLFSDKVKCMVTFPESLKDKKEGALKISQVDPYLLLAREIVAFYQLGQQKQKRANLIRECLFLKALEGMTSQGGKKAEGEDSRLQETMALMKDWHLLPANHEHFFKLMSWRYPDLIKFGAKVHDFLIETYKRLRWTFKTFEDETAVAISERDIAVLGRKLFTFYEVKPNKIEYIRSLSRDAMSQKDITFHISRYKEQDYYYAFQGEHDNTSVKDKTDLIIKREETLIALITWLMANGILTKKTRLHLTKNFLPISLADIQHLVEVILSTFPPVNFSHISADQLLQREKTIRALAVINLNKHQVKGAKNLESTIISTNSYGEYFVHDFTTITQLKNAIRVLLTKHYVSRWNNNLEIFIPPQPEQHVLKSMVFQ